MKHVVELVQAHGNLARATADVSIVLEKKILDRDRITKAYREAREALKDLAYIVDKEFGK